MAGMARSVWDARGGARQARLGEGWLGMAGYGRQARHGADGHVQEWSGEAGTERRGTERQSKDRQAWSGMDGIGKAGISRHLTRSNLWMQSGNY